MNNLDRLYELLPTIYRVRDAGTGRTVVGIVEGYY
jgi:hypothetical protein